MYVIAFLGLVISLVAMSVILGALAHAKFRTGLAPNIGVALLGGFVGMSTLNSAFGQAIELFYATLLGELVGVVVALVLFQLFKRRRPR
jgi:uncharacterized membrane protein YeaQ/YmgE (transglycosylase-associated protein family)